ncbi:hypothetical protein N1030_08890 [Desulfovibrio mangrovi]|uniref:hypothetical protein n=1 Tax=Desulfovibrio mangrovi TaxID=2976983 RepID=UPI00224829A5|nr:hypothetical protein [Desulfovibrio mangrovi]UZP69067.1 hypothetical protein N1030_08890 [Desulfovibrio mangrovi]
MTTRSRFILAALSVLLLALAACGPTNYVRLRYTSELAPAHIQPNAPTVAIVEFADGRSKKDVGIRNDATPFIPVSSVTAWVSEALREELSRKGLNTRYVKSADEVAPGEHVITGTVKKVWLKQNTLTAYSVSIEAAIALDDAMPVTYRSEQERQDIPTGDVTEEHLSETLRTMLSSAVEDLLAKIYNTAN